MNLSKPLDSFIYIEKLGAVVFISILTMASFLDFLFESSQIISVLLMLIMSIGVFFVSQFDIKFDRNVYWLNIIFNVVMLCIAINSRLFLINIVLLSYVFWNLIMPYAAKYRGLGNILFPITLLSLYVVPLFNAAIPLFPLVLFLLYIVGYNLKGMRICTIKYAYLILVLNIIASSSAMVLFLFRIRYVLNSDALKFISLSHTTFSTAVYQPIWAMLLIWVTISYCLFGMYLFRNVINRKATGEGFEQYFKKLTSTAFHTARFFIFAGALIFIAEYAIRGSLRDTIKIISDPPSMFNLLFLCTIYLFFIALTGRVLATFITGILMITLTVANFCKFKYFDEPFYPWDTYILKDAITISKEYVNLPIVISSLIVLLIGFIVLLVLKKNARDFFRPKIMLNLFPAAIAMILINGMIVSSPKDLAKFDIIESWYIGKDEMLANGLLVQNYLYIKNYNKYVLSAPDGYSKETMEEINNRLANKFPEDTKPTTKPNIVLIMNESFWDPTKFNSVDFSEDIMRGFRKYEKGEIISPAIGGGTANVEFEALTGLSNYFMGQGVLVYNVYIRRDTPGVVSVLKDNGYETIAIHPFMPEMYNRNKVYKFFQFDKYISVDSFNRDTDLKGPYVSDDKLTDKVLEILSESSNPKFIFALTMQNHDPYINKYQNLEVTAESEKLTEEEESMLSTYAEGVRDGSDALDKLITALKDSPTPTLVYFFGDHLPRLGTVNDMRDIYNRLNPEDDTYQKDIRTYTTPYASWSNFKETRYFEEPFSPSHIALEILRDSGVDYPSYFNVLEGLKKDNLFLQKMLSKNVDQDDQYIKDYKMIEYDLILGNQYLTKTESERGSKEYYKK